MIDLGKNTMGVIIYCRRSNIGSADNVYRGLVDIGRKAIFSRNYTQCRLFINGQQNRYTIPYIKNKNSSSTIEHEETTSKINEGRIILLQSRGLENTIEDYSVLSFNMRIC